MGIYLDRQREVKRNSIKKWQGEKKRQYIFAPIPYNVIYDGNWLYIAIVQLLVFIGKLAFLIKMMYNYTPY